MIINYTHEPKKELLKYIEEHFNNIVPFVVREGFNFQIRIKPEIHDALTANELSILESYAERGDYYTDDNGLYRNTFYWTNCKEYVYSFQSKYSYKLEMQIVNDYDDYSSDEQIVFFDITEFPDLITINIDCWAKEKFKRIDKDGTVELRR